MSFVDFILDLMWGASEIFLARKKDKDDSVGRGNDGGRDAPDQRSADRDRAARLIGNKTV